MPNARRHRSLSLRDQALPSARVDPGLLALFELEKALYELRYELNNRVDWAQVPLQGIAALAGADRRR